MSMYPDVTSSCKRLPIPASTISNAAAQHDYDESLSGLAVVTEWDDGVGGGKGRADNRGSQQPAPGSGSICRKPRWKHWENGCYEGVEALILFVPTGRVRPIIQFAGAIVEYTATCSIG